jgi:hypothetical protein
MCPGMVKFGDVMSGFLVFAMLHESAGKPIDVNKNSKNQTKRVRSSIECEEKQINRGDTPLRRKYDFVLTLI